MTDHITEEHLGLNELYLMAERKSKELATEVKDFMSKHYKWDTDLEEFEENVPPNYSHYKIDVTTDETCCDDTYSTLYHIDIDLPNDDEAKELANILDGKVTQGLNAGCPEYAIRYTREIKVRAKGRGEAIAIFTGMDDKDRESKSQYIGVVSARKFVTKKSTKCKGNNMPQQFRITFRSEIFIEASSKKEAEEKFGQIELFTEEARNNGASYVETNSVDPDGYVTP